VCETVAHGVEQNLQRHRRGRGGTESPRGDIIRRRELIAPGGVNVYEITEKALEPVLAITSALAAFGTPHLSDPVETDSIFDPAWALTSLTREHRCPILLS